MKKFKVSVVFYILGFIVLLLRVSNAAAPPFAKSVVVSQNTKGYYWTIQEAIDREVPDDNTQWILISVKAGLYKEKIKIPRYKPFIALEGSGSSNTIVQYDGSDNLWDATISVEADNFVAKGIAFQNVYNRKSGKLVMGYDDDNGRKPAAAAFLNGDKHAFYECSFIGLQDTVFDALGRHLFHKCFIEGFVDFICGDGQSVYQDTTLSVVPLLVTEGTIGSITAQSRKSPNDPTGFVFRNCLVTGSGNTYLGRAWGVYSRVIFFKSSFSSVVVPEGWDAWHGKGHEGQLTYAELDCTGVGADTSKRVSWEKKYSSTDNEFVGQSFNNADGWIQNQPLTA